MRSLPSCSKWEISELKLGVKFRKKILSHAEKKCCHVL